MLWGGGGVPGGGGGLGPGQGVASRGEGWGITGSSSGSSPMTAMAGEENGLCGNGDGAVPPLLVSWLDTQGPGYPLLFFGLLPTTHTPSAHTLSRMDGVGWTEV